MKKILVIVSFLFAGYGSLAIPVSHVNENTIRKFSQIYPNAADVIWSNNDETDYVNFKENAIRISILFNIDGTLIRSIRYYSEEYLPYYLISVIREKYPKKKIYGVTEISTPGRIAYYLKLEDANSWMTVKLNSSGKMKVLEEFEKAL